MDRDAGTGAWQLGPELYVLGAVAAHRYPIRELAGPSLESALEWAALARDVERAMEPIAQGH